MGGVRLAAAGFLAMPRLVAIASVAGGICVAGFGVGLLFAVRPQRASHEPAITLEPARPGMAKGAPPRAVSGLVLSGGRPVADARVELTPLFDEPKVAERATRTDERGRFNFDDIDISPGYPYAADVHYDDAVFSSDVLRFGNARSTPVRIAVARTTHSAARLRFDSESIAIVGDEKGVQAVHAITVRNTGTRAYVGRLRLPLLPGATAIDPGAGLDRRNLDLAAGEIVSTAPIVPGRHDLTYTYIASMSRNGIELRHRPAYPTRRFELLLGDGLRAQHVGGLPATGEVRIGPTGQQRTYRRFESRDLGRSDVIRAVIAVAGPSQLPRALGLAGAIVAALAIVAFPLVRRRSRGTAATPAPQPVGSP
jgi:hypothetical protein